jgi:hypothetical protein
MSFLGFTIWFVISAILIGATLWSTSILLKQKRAWEAFAKKHKMAYDKGQFMSSPSVTGHMQGYRVALFAAERQALDVRQRRMMTALEITLPGGLIDGAAIGSTEMLPFLNSLTALKPYTPKSEIWNGELHFFARNIDILEAWLTDERLTHIVAIAGTKNSDNLFMCDDVQGIIRIETRDPLSDPDKIEKAAMRLIKHAKALSA